jgi:hypothetical protein
VNRFWEWPEWKRERFGRFYHRCVQRLLWSRRATRYVSKSPHFLGKIADLRRWYPDARFIYLVRSPHEAIPSALSMITTMWRAGTRRPPSPDALEANYRALVDLAAHGDAALRDLPEDRVTTVPYAQLAGDPRRTIEALYAWLGWPVTDAYTTELERAGQRQRSWRSPHQYSLEQFGLTADRIGHDFAFLFDRHRFDRAA